MIPGIVYSWSRTIPLDELEMYQLFCYPININMELTPYDLILPLFTLWKKYSIDIKTSILVPFLFDCMVFLLSRKPYIIME